MWLLKMLLKTKMEIPDYIIEKEKTNEEIARSDAFISLLCKNEKKEESSSSITNHSKKEKVVLNMSWKEGSVKVDISKGHTSIKEVEGQYILDISF